MICRARQGCQRRHPPQKKAWVDLRSASRARRLCLPSYPQETPLVPALFLGACCCSRATARCFPRQHSAPGLPAAGAPVVQVIFPDRLAGGQWSRFQPCSRLLLRTSSIVGMETAAPFLDTAMDDATDANRSASGTSIPDDTHARKYPVNVSPAAVVSSTFTL